MGDEYLDRLKAMIPKKSNLSKFSKDLRQGYNEMNKTFDGHYQHGYSLYKLGENYLNHYQNDPHEGDIRDGMALKLASKLMKRGIDDRDLEFSLQGLELYNALGLADRTSVKRRFEKAARLDTYGRSRIARAVEIFENPNKGIINKSKGNLEERIIPAFFALSFIAGIFLLSGTITGNIIGSMLNYNPDVLGAGLILLGIIGFFAYRKIK